MRRMRYVFLTAALIIVLSASCSLEMTESNLSNVYNDNRPESLTASDIASMLDLEVLVRELGQERAGLGVAWSLPSSPAAMLTADDGAASVTVTADVVFNNYTGDAIRKEKGVVGIISGQMRFTFSGTSSVSSDSVTVDLDSYEAETVIPVEIRQENASITTGSSVSVSNATGSVDATLTYRSDSVAADGSVSNAALSVTDVIANGGATVSVGDDTAVTNLPWNGQISTSWFDEAENIFYLGSAEELAGLASLVNEGTSFEGSTVYLSADIDLNIKEWTPIGTAERDSAEVNGNHFDGIFDGQGHTISNLYITAPDAAGDTGVGLFAAAGGSTVIRNFSVQGTLINKTTENAGLVVGLIYGNAAVENVTVLEGSSVTAAEAGGIAGRMIKSGTISGCVNNADVTAETGKAGGIVHSAYYDQHPGNTPDAVYEAFAISECVNNGSVSGTSCVGGIAGLSTTVQISDCTNNGTVTGSVYGIGGISGELKHGASITRCVNNGDVCSTFSLSGNYGVGGLAGWIRYDGGDATYNSVRVSSIADSVNNGDVSSAANTGIGGAVGQIYNAAEISDTENYGTVTTESGLMIGGFVGGLQGDSGTYNENRDTITFTNCYTDAGVVSAPEGTTNRGDFAGHPYPTIQGEDKEITLVFNDCFVGDEPYNGPDAQI